MATKFERRRPAISRLKRLGMALAPELGAAHLSLRYGARLALLRALMNAKKAERELSACVTHEDRVAIWRYLSGQTNVATESRWWLCLSPVHHHTRADRTKRGQLFVEERKQRLSPLLFARAASSQNRAGPNNRV